MDLVDGVVVVDADVEDMAVDMEVSKAMEAGMGLGVMAVVAIAVATEMAIAMVVGMAAVHTAVDMIRVGMEDRKDILDTVQEMIATEVTEVPVQLLDGVVSNHSNAAVVITHTSVKLCE